MLYGVLKKEKLEEIAKEESPERDILRNYMPIAPFFDGEAYLQIHTVSLPRILLQAKSAPGKKADLFDSYMELANQADDELKWTQIHLANGLMPDKGRLELMLDMQVRDSKSFGTTYDYLDYGDARDVAMAAYEGLHPAGNIALLADKTDTMIKDVISRTLRHWYQQEISVGQRELLGMLFSQIQTGDAGSMLLGPTEKKAMN